MALYLPPRSRRLRAPNGGLRQTASRIGSFSSGKATSSGHGGCNRFGGRYTFHGGAIEIGPLFSTKMACAPEVMDAEQGWFHMLENARAAEATSKTLILKDAADNIIATLRRKDWD